MLSLTLAAVCFLLGGAHFVRAGFVPPAELCLPDSGLKELSGCIAMDSRIDSCKAKPNREEALDCYCVQEMLDSYYACKEDVYKCVRSHVLDPQFDDNIRGWHQACDGRLATKTTTITTPPEPTLTSTYDLGACNRLATSCFSGDYETNLCSRSWLPTSSLSFISCTCRPPVYSLMSECFYNGNISCKLEPGYKTNIPGYSQCPYFWSGSETLPPTDLTSFMPATESGARSTAEHLQQIATTAIPPRKTTFATVTQTRGWDGDLPRDL